MYSAGRLEFAHERKQMDQLLHLLKLRFGVARVDCKVIVDVRADCQIEALVIKDNKWVILELKDIRGKIEADCAKGALWRIWKDGLRIELQQENPFYEVGRHRGRLLGFLWWRVLKGSKQESIMPFWEQEQEIPGYFRRQVSAWVAVNPGAEIVVSGIDEGAHPWFEVLPIDGLVHELKFEGASTPLLSKPQFDEFIDLIAAEEMELDDWLLRGRELVSLNESANLLRVPKLDSLLTSGKPENLLRGLGLAGELELRSYMQDVRVLTGNDDSLVRREALKLLVEWRPPELGDRLAEALEDPDESIRSSALEYLRQDGYPEAVYSLAKLLDDQRPEVVCKAMEALAASKDPKACKVVLQKAEIQPNIESNIDFRVWSALCKAISSLSCKESVPLLLNQLRSLEQSVGDTKGPSHWSILEDTVSALGRLQDRRATKPLVELLGRYSDDVDQIVIRALGDLGDKSTTKLVTPYLKSGEDYLRQDAVSALGKLGAQAAFAEIWKLFLLSKQDPIMERQAEEALAEIDGKRFEGLLLGEIASSQNSSMRKDELLLVLRKVATWKSVHVLFSLLSDPDLCWSAAGILYKFSDDKNVMNRVDALTESSDQYEKATALSILCERGAPRLDARLETFEEDPAAVVRLMIASYYSEGMTATNTLRLLKFSSDNDRGVRMIVFHTLRSKAKDVLGNCLIALSDGRLAKSDVILSDYGVSASLKDEVLVIDTPHIRRCALVRENGRVVGIWLACALEKGKLECLFKPHQQITPWPMDRDIVDWRVQLTKIAKNGLGNVELNPKEREAVQVLNGILADTNVNEGESD